MYSKLITEHSLSSYVGTSIRIVYAENREGLYLGLGVITYQKSIGRLARSCDGGSKMRGCRRFVH